MLSWGKNDSISIFSILNWTTKFKAENRMVPMAGQRPRKETAHEEGNPTKKFIAKGGIHEQIKCNKLGKSKATKNVTYLF